MISSRPALALLCCGETSINLGDNIQNIAVRQLLHKYLPDRSIQYYLDRDSGVLLDAHTLVPVNMDAHKGLKVAVVYSGWWDGAYTDNFPPNPEFVSHWLILSFHVNELPKDASYSWLNERQRNDRSGGKSLIDPNRFHLLNEQFVGCRDPHTVRMFHKQGYTRAYLSRCLTMTLGTVYPLVPYDLPPEERQKVYLVDVDADSPVLHHSGMPAHLRAQIVPVSHVWEGDPNDIHGKNHRALELLQMYARAKLVITSRLHCALPSLSYGTPVLSLYHDMNDVRFEGLLDSVSVLGRDKIYWNDLMGKHVRKTHDWHLKVKSMMSTVEEWTRTLH